MYTYNYGAIGEAVRAKIENYKQQVRGGSVTSDSFADVLKTYLTKTDSDTKVVSATGNNTLTASETSVSSTIDGSTLLYALQNSDIDTTASTVLSALGFTASGDGSAAELKTAADSLSASAEQLLKANSSGADMTMVTSEFVADFNRLMTLLNIESTSSAYLYKNAFSAMLNAASEELASAGIIYESGFITYNGNGSPIPDIFLSNIASTASTVSNYAGSIAAQEDDESYSGVSEYYSSLISSMI